MTSGKNVAGQKSKSVLCKTCRFSFFKLCWLSYDIQFRSKLSHITPSGGCAFDFGLRMVFYAIPVLIACPITPPSRSFQYILHYNSSRRMVHRLCSFWSFFDPVPSPRYRSSLQFDYLTFPTACRRNKRISVSLLSRSPFDFTERF